MACGCRPLVIVEGFLGRSSPAWWGNFERFLRWRCEGCTRKAIFTSVGPVSSLHDRACELYYSLAGGRVDYGEEHSRQHSHARYGRTYDEGLCRQWSQQYPLHFLGHSIGGPTILKLQHLLKLGHFGDHAHPDMILSVNTVCSPFRGTQIIYTLGESVDAAPAVRPLSWGAFLAKGIHIFSYFSPFLPGVLDLHTDSRALSLNDISFVSFLKQLWKSDWAESRDATPYDVTFAAADEREAEMEGKPHLNTFYRSYSGYTTRKISSENNQHLPTFTFARIPFYFMSRAIGIFDFSQLEPPPSFLKQRSPNLATTSLQGLERGESKEYESLSEEYYANDGVVPLFSQWHPYPCSMTECQHSKPPDHDHNLQPGIWYVHEIENVHHTSLVPSFLMNARQRQYWIELGHWLTEIDRRTAPTISSDLAGPSNI